MSYFPCDIPFMSDEELKENGIMIHKDAEIPHEPHIPFETLQNACKYRRTYHIEGYFEKRHVCYNKKNAAECNSDCPLLNRKWDGGVV